MPRALVKTVALVALILGACGCRNEIALPEELSGTYVTRHRMYDDRSFTLTPKTFAVHLDEDDSVKYPIREILFEPNGQGPHTDLYTVVYANQAGQEYTMRFYVRPDTEGDLVFSNQPEVVWNRKEGRL